MKTILFFKSSDLNALRKRVSGFMAFAEGQDWSVHILEPIADREELKKIVTFWRPDGCVACCGSGRNDFPASAFHAPTVYIDRPHRTLSDDDSYVCHSPSSVSELAATELLPLNLASYAYVGYARPHDWDLERRDAFNALLRLHGKVPACFPGGLDTNRARDEVKRLARWLRDLPGPTGIFAATDLLGREVLNAAQRADLKVPDDLAVVGVDDDEDVCEYTTPTLSSVEPGFRQAGYEAATMLDALMKGRTRQPIHKRHGALRVVRRESTRRLKHNDRFVAAALERIRKEACSGLNARTVLAGFPCARRMAETRFRNLTGRSVLEEIRCVRLERAKELLGETDAKLSAVANWCGYDSAAAFAVFFKAETGMTPRQFAKSCNRRP